MIEKKQNSAKNLPKKIPKKNVMMIIEIFRNVIVVSVVWILG